MSKRTYDQLKKRVYDGAVLYVSLHDGILTEFETLTGFRPIRSSRQEDHGIAEWKHGMLPYARKYRFELQPVTGETIIADAEGFPLLGHNQFGKGAVWLLNLPLEENLLNQKDGFDQGYYYLYKTIAQPILELAPVRKQNPFVGMTFHQNGGTGYAVLINYSAKEQITGFSWTERCAEQKTIYGNENVLEPFGAAVVKWRRIP